MVSLFFGNTYLEFLAPIVTLCFLTGYFFLNRAGYYSIAVLLTILTMSAGLIEAAIPDHQPNEIYILDSLVLSVLISSIFLKIRFAAGLTVLHLIAILIFTFIVPNVSVSDLLTGPLIFNALISMAIIIVSHYRNQLEASRQTEILEKEQRFRALIENSSDITVVINALGEILYGSPSIQRILGYLPENLVNRVAFDFVHPEDTDLMAQVLGKSLENPKVPQYVASMRALPSDGTILNFELIVNNLLADPIVNGIIVNARDITERVQAESELYKSRHFLERVIEATPDLIYVYDYITRTNLYTNRTLTEMLGYTTEQVQQIEDNFLPPLLYPGDFTKLENSAIQMKQSKDGEVVETEFRIRDNAGEWHWLLARAVVFNRGPDGVPISSLGLTHDITLRKQAETALAAEKERLKVTLQSIADGVITTDNHGQAVLLNRVAEKLTGWTQTQVSKLPVEEFLQLIEETSDTVVENPVRKVLETGLIVEPVKLCRLIARDGRQYVIKTNAAPIHDSFTGQNIGVVLVFWDETERHQLQEQLQTRQKLESLGVLAGGIAHDFNNILTVMIGRINIAVTQLKAGDTTDLMEDLTEVEKAIFRAKDLTQQLMTFAKGGNLIKTAVSLPTLLKASVEFVLHGTNTRSQFTIAENLWTVEIDQNQISQVISNIVINAAQSMPEGGVISLSADNIPLRLLDPTLPLQEADYVRVRIKDEGTGIPPDMLNRIFDPYFTTKTSGNGLGLAMCYSIIRQHNGHISVTSEVGKGTTFAIYLPITVNLPETTSPPENHLIAGNGRLLILDDDTRILTFLGKGLRQSGYEVDSCDNGPATIALYRQKLDEGYPYDLVIMDLTISGGIGAKEVIAHLHEIDPSVKALVCSGYAYDPVMVDYQNYGFRGAVSKPFRFNDLTRKINEILNTPL